DDTGIGAGLAARLAARGEHSTLVFRGSAFEHHDGHLRIDPSRPQDFEQMLRDIGADLRGVVHLWNLDLGAPARGALPDQVRGSGSVLHLAQALVTRGVRPPGVWIVTRNAQPIVSGLDVLAVAQAPAWGLRKTVVLEHPELHCKCVDLDPAAPPDEVDAL